ncbi:MAG: aspartate-semialdehyde dehydrogenase, partial [Woeseiaceae bacterium]
MSDRFDLAVVGATGVVGEAMLGILHQRKFPVGNVYALASERSLGKTVAFGNRQLNVENLADFDFSKVAIGLFSAGGSVSAEFAPKAAAAGCVVVDNTSHFRREDDIPLVVPEVNAEAIAGYTARGIIANPNCSTIQMLVALKQIYDAVGLERINVCTYQAVSGAGRSAVEELARQTAALMNGRPLGLSGDAKQIGFNAIPHIDSFMD